MQRNTVTFILAMAIIAWFVSFTAGLMVYFEIKKYHNRKNNNTLTVKSANLMTSTQRIRNDMLNHSNRTDPTTPFILEFDGARIFTDEGILQKYSGSKKERIKEAKTIPSSTSQKPPMVPAFKKNFGFTDSNTIKVPPGGLVSITIEKDKYVLEGKPNVVIVSSEVPKNTSWKFEDPKNLKKLQEFARMVGQVYDTDAMWFEKAVLEQFFENWLQGDKTALSIALLINEEEDH